MPGVRDSGLTMQGRLILSGYGTPAPALPWFTVGRFGLQGLFFFRQRVQVAFRVQRSHTTRAG